jgi:hypothetical protein
MDQMKFLCCLLPGRCATRHLNLRLGLAQRLPLLTFSRTGLERESDLKNRRPLLNRKNCLLRAELWSAKRLYFRSSPAPLPSRSPLSTPG